ncbi:MAG: ATP-binding protein, partial [Flammeovirgaceae bacterium]|nr:ATP-binding protein [Flammeovirgaceae bacterium]
FEKKEAIQKASLEKATLTRNIVIVSIIVVLIGFVILFQRYKEKQYFNHQLSERNAEIMAQGEKISEQNKILEQQKAQLEQALREKEEAVVAKSRFLSTMSHEIRTPMNAVIGFTNILLMENPLPYQMEYLNSLKFSATHLLSLLNDILDFSKIEEGKITFEKTKINLSLTLEEIRKMFLPKAEEKKISLQLAQPTEELHHELLGDIVRFNQVMTNLVSNAVKFTEKGRVVIAYKILEENDASITLQFSVSDTGIGIPAEKLEAIFESFTQATPDTTRRFGGTGLGLAISKKLIELQGGKIWVESQLGVGTTFYFTLSFEKGAPLAHPNETPSLPASNTEEDSLQGMKVLLVEDNKMNVMVAKKLLEKWQLEISYASDGEEAVEKVKQSPTFDVILMDLHMPNMDGVEATRQIRLLPGDYFQHVPIIALTASASVDTRERVLRAGMNACVVKPFNPSNLHEMLRKYYRSASLT